MGRNFNVGDIFGEAWRLIEDARRDVQIFIVVVGGLGLLGIMFGFSEVSNPTAGFGYRISTSDGAGSSAFELLSAAVSVVAGYLLLTRYLAARGRLHEGGTRFWHYIVMVILSGIAIAIGFVFVIIPGVILLVRWSAASGFVIGAREGIIASLGASWEATKGHSGPIFLAGLLFFIVVVVGGIVLAGVLGAISAQFAAIAASFLEAFMNAVGLAFGIAIYCLVHDDTQEIGEVFS